jgi:hypothetical protein
MRESLMHRLVPAAIILGLLAACSSSDPSHGPPSVLGAVSVASGSAGSCAVGGAGGLVCWGALPDGTPGDTSTTGADVLGATAVSVPIDLIGIALGRPTSASNSGCMVGSDHVTYCWGHLNSSTAEVSLGAGISALSGGGSASSVAMDIATLCVTRTDNAVRCYGGFYGGGRGTDSVTLGDAGPGFTLTANGLHPAQAAFGTALGYQFGCAIRTDSLVACWGTRHRGQLGGAVADSVQDCSSIAPAWCQPGAAAVAGGIKYRQVSAQLDHACATRIDGGVDCWGRKVGTPIPGASLETCASASDCVATPTAVTLPGAALRVVVGSDHACALLTTGDVYCWGDNGHGQLGRPGAASLTPVKVGGGFIFSTISAGVDHTCAVEAGSGAIGCWGRNSSGQLGDGTTTDRDHPVAVVLAQ